MPIPSVGTCKFGRDFYEAVQAWWIIFIIINPNHCIGIGRFDQYMYPFYRMSIDSGKHTDEDILEILECPASERYGTQRDRREKAARQMVWKRQVHNMVIGGVKKDGTAATNELSYLILEAARRCPGSSSHITVRVDEKTPDKLMMKALEIVRMGIGLPAFVSDKSYMEYFMDAGASIYEARNYAIAGCLDGEPSRQVPYAERADVYQPADP